MVLTFPEGGLAPLPSCGELTSEGLFLSMMEVLGFPALFSLDVLIPLTQLFYPCTAKSGTVGMDVVLVRKVWRGFVEPCKESRGVSGLQCMLYHALAGNWAFF